ncbi:hypothetical protein A9Q81_23280 [Gammaproteobacteria bacterium 42_54_T18]|nr:hypothetical protein A9Q81_23280 [Gammaproteobacteria bacterium 42_54_T18]
MRYIFTKDSSVFSGNDLALFIVMLITLFSNVSTSVAAELVADDAPLVVDIALPAQPLEDSLTQLAILYRIPIIFRSDIVKGLSGKTLEGKYSLESSLAVLLTETPLKYTIVDNTLVTVIRVNAEGVDGLRKDNDSSPISFSLDINPPLMSEIVVVGESLDIGCCRDIPSTATKTYTPTIEVPKSLEGIDSSLFSDRGNATLSEAFRDYSSVNVTDLKGNINVRGFKLSDRALLKDGQSIVSHGIAPLTLNNIEGIEVAKGANSTLYGYGQPGAVINLVTKKPSPYAFTNLAFSTGNYDRYLSLDTNGPVLSSDNMLYRFNVLKREETTHKKSQGSKASEGKLRQTELSPSMSYQFNETDKVQVAIDYSHQRVNGFKGKRPFDDLVVGEIFGVGLFDVIYPSSEHNTLDFYPYSGSANEEIHDSKIIELNVRYQGLTESGWDLAINTYYGNNQREREYANDMSVWLNPTFDPQPFFIPLFNPTTYLQILFDNNADFIQNYQDVRSDFIEFMGLTYGLDEADIIDAIYNQGDDFPLWEDNQVHFYQLALDQKTSSHQHNIDMSVGKEFTFLNAGHYLLLGFVHTETNAKTQVNQRYNKGLYDQGAGFVAEGGSDNQYLGWALQRYAMVPWYNPFGSSPDGIVLPSVISRLAGYPPGELFPLDSSFLYSSTVSKTRLTGVFFQDQISLDERWKLLVSAGFYQYDREYEVTNINSLQILVGEIEYLTSGSDASDDFIAPQVGLSYLPIENVSLYANYGLQYDLLTGVDASLSPLEPEETATYEMGMKWWPSQDVNLSLSFFRMTKNNWSITDGNNFIFRVQEGRFRSAGYEFSLLGFIVPHVKAAINFTKTKTESLKQSVGGRNDALLAQTQIGVPSNSGSFWLQYHNESYGTHGWAFGFGATHVGGREFTQQYIESKFNEYTLVDVAVSYLHEDFRIALNVDNVTDEEWIVGSGIAPSSATSPRYLAEGPGIRYRFTTELFY